MKLFLIWDEDNCLYIYSSADSASAIIEALDVVEIKAAFDSDAIPYQVEWIKPNDSRSLFGRISLTSNGEYRFVVKGESNFPAFMDMIRAARDVMCGEQNPNRPVREYVNKIINLRK